MKGVAEDYIELFEDLTLENITEWVAECKKLDSKLPHERSVLASTLRGIARTLGKYKWAIQELLLTHRGATEEAIIQIPWEC